MDTINNIVCSLIDKSSDVWVVEWYFSEDGEKSFNVNTLDKYLLSNYRNFKNGKNSQYHLLGFCDSIDSAHVLIDEIRIKELPSNVYPFRPVRKK